MKKIKGIFLALLIMAISPAAVYADDAPNPIIGPGEWDIILSGNYTATKSGSTTSTVTSGGGDIRVCTSGVNAGNNAIFQVFTSSGTPVSSGSGVYNSTSSSSPYQCMGKIDVSSFVNSNGKVNLYIKMTSLKADSDSVYVELQD